MANRRDYFTDQLVSQSELDAGFAGLESADWAQFADLALKGVVTGLGVAQHSPTADLTVDVAIGVSYDKLGKRMSVPSLQVVNLGVDSNSVSTAVVNAGQSKIVSLFLRFKRSLTDQRTDGLGATVFHIQDESFEFFIEQGAEAVSPTPPALRSDSILLADITRTFGQTQILTVNISATRKEDMFKLSAGAIAINTGTPVSAMQSLLTELNNHVTGASNVHPASAIAYGGGANFADGATNPASSVEVVIDNILTSLGGSTGSQKVGFASSGNLATGTVRSALLELDAEKGGLALANTWTQANTFNNRIEALGGIRRRAPLALTDAATSISNPTLYDAIKIPNTLTANRNYTILDPNNSPVGETEGYEIYVYRRNPDADWQAFLYRGSDSALLITFPVVVGAWAILKVESAVWQVVAWGGGAVYNEASAP